MRPFPILLGALCAAIPSALLASPAAPTRLSDDAIVSPAGMICDANGCRVDTSTSALPDKPNYGRSYYGTDDAVKRALADRDRQRRERAQRESGQGDQRDQR